MPPIERIYPLNKSFYFTKNATMLKITSEKTNTMWRLGISYSNPSEPMKLSFNLWCWLTICFYYSREPS